MSYPRDTFFTPEEVDQQIERYRSGQHGVPDEQAAHKALQRIQHFYRIDQAELAPSLGRVWQRVLDAEASMMSESSVLAEQSDIAMPHAEETQPTALLHAGTNNLPGQSPRQPRKQRTRPHSIDLLLIACLILMVGGFFWITLYASHQNVSTVGMVNTLDRFYAYHNQTVYGLNSQHAVVWTHTFANNEAIYDAAIIGNSENKPFVVGDVLYIETRKDLSGELSLYGLNRANGAVLWKMPMQSQTFATSQAFYEVFASPTSDVSTLTAYDALTGEELWRHAYTIAGSMGPADIDDGTPRLGLSAVSDQVLYAVSSYHLHGQEFFARYALSARDGSILWHHDQAISGSMYVASQLVNGVIYTNEYNLTTQENTHGEPETQVRTSAYKAATGEQLWQTAPITGEQPAHGGFNPFVVGSLLYYQTVNSLVPATVTLHALTIADGSQLWKHQTRLDAGNVSGFSVDSSNIYFETSAQANLAHLQLTLVALDAQTGAVRWSRSVPSEDDSALTPVPTSTPTSKPHGPASSAGVIDVDSEPVVYNKIVYYSIQGNKIYALRPSDGKILAQFRISLAKADPLAGSKRMTLVTAP